jgi:hypothetical protein
MLLLGNVGQQLDIGDLERTINDMHGAVADNEQVDEQQARSIEQLQRENRELKLYLATLVKLLVGKGVLRPEEVEVAVQAIEAKA